MENQVFVQNNGSAEWNLDGTCRSTELPVLIINPTGGKSAAVQLVKKSVPPSIDGLPLSYIRFDEYDSDGNINMVAVYDSKSEDNTSDDVDEPESTISVNGGGGSSHVTEALAQTELFNDSQIKNDPKLRVGWNGKKGADSEVTGVDIIAPNCKLVITKKMRISSLTTSYIRKCLKLIGKVNASSFKGWEKGEVLFEDFSYTLPDNADKKVDVTFNFAVQMNESGYSYHGRTISKLGWEYVWSMTEEVKTENEGEKKTELKTVSAYKAQVYPFGNFSSLGL